eukprot:gene11372-4540_t
MEETAELLDSCFNFQDFKNSEKNTYMKKVVLSNCQLNNNHLIQISKSLEENSSLTFLDLKGNHFRGSLGLEQLSKALQSNKHINHVDISHNHFYETGKWISSVVRCNSTLVFLSLKSTWIDDKEAIYLAKGFCDNHNHSIKTLDLSNNLIGSKGIEHLSNALENVSTLTELQLHGNYITDECISHLGKLIDVHKKLRILDLSSNEIGNIGFQLLAESVEKNHTLTNLNLAMNDADDESMYHFLRIIKYNTNLLVLQLSLFDDIDDKTTLYLKQNIEMNKFSEKKISHYYKFIEHGPMEDISFNI